MRYVDLGQALHVAHILYNYSEQISNQFFCQKYRCFWTSFSGKLLVAYLGGHSAMSDQKKLSHMVIGKNRKNM